MKKLFILLLLINSIGCSNQSAQSTNNDNLDVKNTIAYKLLSLDSSSNNIQTNDPNIKELSDKISQLSDKTGLSEQEIADMSWTIEKEIRNNNVDVSIWNIFDLISKGIDEKAFALKAHNTKQGLSSWLAFYAITRIKANQDHNTALNSLVDISKVANDPDKMAELQKSVS